MQLVFPHGANGSSGAKAVAATLGGKLPLRRSALLGGFFNSQSPFCGSKHLFEPRIVADWIQVRIDVGVTNFGGAARKLKIRFQSLDRGFRIIKIMRERTCDIVSTEQVV